MVFKDHFSTLAAAYAAFRPDYPPELFVWLAGLCERHALAWDCGTGNGQAAPGLAAHFIRVIATDASVSQIAEAHQASAQGPANIEFRVAPAERSGLADATVDLLLVAQAAHWFDLDAFYAEARRVLRPGGIIALLTYSAHRVSPEVDGPALHFYRDVVGPYWPPERKWVENGYRDLPFPFTELQTPAFMLEADWDLPHFLGYQATWSATRRYTEARGESPMPALEAALAPVWGAPEQVRRVRWPLALRVARVG
jgi:SAM-dependent methyltransferase